MRGKRGLVRGAIAVALLAALVAIPAEPAAAATFIVNSTGNGSDTSPGNGTCDTGGTNSQGATECTLRAAIQEANSFSGTDTIGFNIPTTDANHQASPIRFLIPVPTRMTSITDPVIIDGTTQPEFGGAGRPVIVLDGTGMSASDPNGLTLQAGSSTIRGLVIQNFADDGIEIEIGGGNTIVGNYIGTDVTGTADRGNDYGIAMKSGNNVVGGTSSADRNVISGNDHYGLAIYSSATGNQISGNYIGVDAGGSSPLPNSINGLEIDGGATNNLIGGTSAGSGNVIAHNTGRGVVVTNIAGDGNSIIGNSIFANSSIGIDLGEDGVSPNIIGDGWYNFPEITSALESGGTVTVDFDVELPAGDYRIEFFSNASGADPTGNGEGQSIVAAKTISHTGTGSEAFSHNFVGAIGDIVTMTTTEENPGPSFGATSEFSASTTVIAAPTFQPMAVWRENGQNAPRFSEWDGATFGSTQVSSSIGQLRNVQGAAAPTRLEAIIVGVSGTNTIAGEIWDGSTWSALPSLGTTDETFWWGADVAYEALSGNAMVVYADGANLAFRTWDGAAWSAETLITEPVSGTPRQMQLAAHPSSDEMTLIVSSDSSQDYALVWDGSSWGNAVTLSAGGDGDAKTDVYAAYESVSGDALVVYGKGIDDVHYRVWDGGSWSSESTLAGIGGDYARWMTLASDPTSNNVILGVSTNDADAWLAVWNGTSWFDQVTVTLDTTGTNHPAVAVAFEAGSGEAIATYGENTTTPRYRTWTSGSGWSVEQNVPDIGAVPNSMMLYSEPGTDNVMFAVQNANRNVDYINWDGISWGSSTQLVSDSAETKNQPFTFIWQAAEQTAPVAVDDVASTLQDLPVSIDVLGNDTDPQGDSLTIVSATPGSNGTTSTDGTTVTYTPAVSWTGVDTFTYTITDGAKFDTATVTISVLERVVLKSTQKGTLTLSGGSSTAGATISSVDPSRAFLVFTIRENLGDPQDGLVTGHLASPTSVVFDRLGTIGSVTIEWSVVEFTSGVTVQRGSTSLATTTVNVPITSVDLTKSFPIVSQRAGGAVFDDDDWVRARLTGNTNLELSTISLFSNVVEWQVVQYNESAVQSGDLSFSAFDTIKTATTTTVATSKSMLVYGYRSNFSVVPNIAERLIRGAVTDSTTLTFDRSIFGATADLTWYLVEFEDAATVQRGNAAFLSAEASQDVAIAAVDPARAVALGGYQLTGGRSPYILNDVPGVAWFTLDLTTGSNLHLQRSAALATADIAWSVVYWPATEWTVNSTGDTPDTTPGDGVCDTGGTNSVGNTECTLRAAIQEANASPLATTIEFAIPTTESGHTPSPVAFTISPTTALDPIIGTVTIDATTQPEFAAAGRPVVELDGSTAGLAHGLQINASDSEIRGFVINRFQQNGIAITGGAARNLIAGNYIGTDVTGSIGGSFASGTESLTLTVAARDNIIGGLSAADRNVFGAAGVDNLRISGIGTDDNQIIGNHIGVDAAGTSPLGTGQDGIDLGGNADGTRISGNVISGSAEDGIDLATASNSVIQGNLIGVDASGNNPLPNASDGIEVDGTGVNNLIGGSTSGEGNVIGANTIGIWVAQVTVGMVIEGNSIGVGSDGTTALGNSGQGILIDNGASNVRIGGTAPGAGNEIANNSTGIEISDGTGNSALGNSIRDNSGLGIDLAPGGVLGVTPNDFGDADSGPNDLLNFPVSVAATELAGTVTVDFTLDVPVGDYRVEVFSNAGGADPTGSGEGETFESASTISHDGAGPAIYAVSYSGVIADVITVTATEEFSPTSFGATSEFATAVHSLPSGLWFSTADAVSGASTPGITDWAAGEVITLQDPNHQLDPSITDGTLMSVLDLTPFDGGSDVSVTSFHYVTTETTVGASPAFTVFPGDVLIATNNSVALTSTNSISVTRNDIFAFRPDTIGDYSSGSFFLLLDDPVGSELRSLALVQTATVVGDVVVLPGDILYSRSGGGVHGDVKLFRATGTGSGSTSGSSFDLLVGPDWGNTEQIWGVALAEQPFMVADEVIPVGAVILTVDKATTPGDNNVAVEPHDIFYLVATTTNLGSGSTTADATLLLDGSDISLSGTEGKIKGLSLVGASSAQGSFLTVNSTGDAGDAFPGDALCSTGSTNSEGELECTLRAAIEETNASTFRDTIKFDIPVSDAGHAAGIWTITPAAVLPVITSRVMLDARTQPGYPGSPTIKVDGTSTGGTGITIGSGAGSTVITGLAIVRFASDGIRVNAGAGATTIWSNWIGSDGSGSPAMGNGDDGLDIQASNVLVDGNVINNSGDEGIDVGGSGVTIVGNIVGLEADGSTGAGNNDVGISLFGDAARIGGPVIGDRNIISMNSKGIEINSSANHIHGNQIGTDVTGLLDRGNRVGDGVEINIGNANIVGGTVLGDGNLIAFNQLKGVDISGGTANTILGNIVHSNGGLGIDLGTTGVTANDPLDADSGPNDLLNRAEISTATVLGITVTLTGTFDMPAGNYRFEIFTNPVGSDPSGSGEGQQLVAASTISHSGAGPQAWGSTYAGFVGDIITATITEESAGPVYGSTSEFSAALTAVPFNMPPVADAGGPYVIAEGDALALDGSGSSDPDGDPIIYSWDIDNDGLYDDATLVSPIISWSALVALGFVDDGGPFTIGLQVDDATSGTSTATTVMTIVNSPPNLSMTGTGSGVPSATYDVTLAASDPGADTITSWTINWGDGTIDTIAGNPTSASHAYSTAGTYNIAASVDDEDGTFMVSRLQVADFWGGTAEEYDGNVGNQIREFTSNLDLVGPADVTVGPDGLTYVSGFTSNTIVRYDTATGVFVDTFVAVGSGGLDGPGSMIWTPEGDLLVTSYNTDSVKRYDGSTGIYAGDFVASGSGGLSRPVDLTWRSDGDLFVSGWLSNNVIRYDGTTGAFEQVFVSTGLSEASGIDFGPDGNLYVGNHNAPASVEVYDGASGAPMSTFTTLASPYGLTWGPDGNLWVASETDDLINVYDPSGLLLRTHSDATDGLGGPWMLDFTPDHQVGIRPLVVNSTGDAPDISPGDGACDTGSLNSEAEPECTLRSAIDEANALLGPDSIGFAIPTSDPNHNLTGNAEFTIQPASALPQITESVTIDGYTQPGASANTVAQPGPSDAILLIEIMGSAAGTGVDGLSIVAGPTVLRGLIVSAFSGSGVRLAGGTSDITGNFIGLDVTGALAVGNGADGIIVTSSGNQIGGTLASEGNVISANASNGVLISAGSGNTIKGNFVGTAADGATPLGNLAAGVAFEGTSTANIVGGTAPGAANLIAHNLESGIQTVSNTGTAQSFLTNRIHSNALIGIDIGADGVTGNDVGDADTGPNGLLNFVELSSSVESGGSITATYDVDVVPGVYRVEFFNNSVGSDPSGYGEGHTFVSADVINHLGGTRSYVHTFTGTAGDIITATVTEQNAGPIYGATSEFSAAVTTFILPTASIDDSSIRNRAARAGGGLDSTVSASGIAGGSMTFDGGPERVVGPAIDTTSGTLSVSAWFNADVFGTDPRIVSKAAADGDAVFDLFVDDTSATTGTAVARIRLDGTTYEVVGGSLTTATWHQIAAIWDGSTLVLYVDGLAVDAAPTSGVLDVDSSVPTIIGNLTASDRGFDGTIDEVRISHTARDATWVALTNRNLSSPGSFVSVGEEQTDAPSPWTISSAQTRSGTSALAAPTIVNTDAWVTARDIDTLGVTFETWWWISTATGIDLAQGTRTGSTPVTQYETALTDPTGYDLGNLAGGTRNVDAAPPPGQTPALGAWTKVRVSTDQDGNTSVWINDVELVAPTTHGTLFEAGSVGLRAGGLPVGEQWFIDDAIARHFVNPEPVATLRAIDRQ